MKYQLVLVRHGESEWNQKNLFTGWTDVNLSEKGKEEAYQAGKLLMEKGFEFDLTYTSYLKRAIHTLNIILDAMDRNWLPVTKDWHLNERHYGGLQGLNKKETADQYGEKQVLLWRRSYDVLPPKLAEDDDRYAQSSPAYQALKPEEIPQAESLKETIQRVVPYFESEIKPKMLAGKRILIVAHGNSLRALVKYFEDLTPDEILEVNIPTGSPLVYEFDENFAFTNKYYLK